MENFPLMPLLCLDKNMNYRQTGGLRVGEMNLTCPFAKISIDPNSVEIKSTFRSKPYQLKKNQIIGLKKYAGVMSSGLQIEHNRKDIPQFIVFWSFKLPELISELEGMDYSITE